MARPRHTDRPVRKDILLPGSLAARVELRFYSEVEGKVPYGVWKKYIVELVAADMDKWQANQREMVDGA